MYLSIRFTPEYICLIHYAVSPRELSPYYMLSTSICTVQVLLVPSFLATVSLK